MSEEDIGKTLFTLLYRHERKLKSQIKSLEISESDEADSDDSVRAAERIDELVQTVTDDAKRRLAEYTIKRHQIIHSHDHCSNIAMMKKKQYQWNAMPMNLSARWERCWRQKTMMSITFGLSTTCFPITAFFASDKAMSAFGVKGERKRAGLDLF